MFDTASASKGVKLALLEGQLLAREIDRTTFVSRAADLGLPAAAVGEAAERFEAIAFNQGLRRANLRSTYDYIVIGSGASGSVVARRLAENRDAQVLLLEAGGDDLKPGILITETWFFNQGGELDWNFGAERSPGVNNRSIVQAAGKALGGGTSINAMVWARGHKNDFDFWARQAGEMPGTIGISSTSTGASRTGMAPPILNDAAAAARSSCSPPRIPVRSRRLSSRPPDRWASPPSRTRTA